MYIKEIKVENYKSFFDSGSIKFSPNFTVIVGQNNSGKTALIEAISLQIGDYPHKSTKTLPNLGTEYITKSKVHIKVDLSHDEFVNYVSIKYPKFSIRRNQNLKNDCQIEKINELFSIANVYIHGTYFTNGLHNPYFNILGNYDSDMSFQFQYQTSTASIELLTPNLGGTSILDTLPGKLLSDFRNEIYFFKAERFNIGENQIETSDKLQPNAINLPSVLHVLQTSNPNRFNRLIDQIKIIFPEIKQITVPPISNNLVGILLWNNDPIEERSDLSIPLQQSGTGIGQIIAILYVAITSESPRPILIDEPQSFLHPGAVRKLFSILKTHYPMHQYIITTHSPLVISAANPEAIIHLQKSDAESRHFSVNYDQTDEMNKIMTSVGARLSDVFGADNIIWVEGLTEEKCFPLILTETLKIPLLGTVILGVLNVGDFERADPEIIFRIYKRLSSGKGLLPPALGFIFDREKRSDQVIEDLIRESNGKVKFINRRMYENYLLNPHAIAYVLNQNIKKYCDDYKNSIFPEETIDQWISKHGLDNKYLDNSRTIEKVYDNNWFLAVNGSKLLKDLFTDLSDNRLSYDKVYNGIELTSWIVHNAPSDVQEVAELLQMILK